jgi:hypothetical protein
MSTLASLLPPAAAKLDSTVRIVAVISTALMLGIVLELVRRRRLAERYALLWMLVAGVLLLLAIWTQLLNWVAVDLLHFAVPANFLFVAASGVAFVLLLHFSVATSRLAEETKILAQEVARLDAELRATHANGAGAGEPPEAAGSAAGTAEQAQDDRPVGGQRSPQ